MWELIFSFLIMIASYALLLSTMRHAWGPIRFSLVLVSITSGINCLANIRLCALGHTFLQNYDDFANLAFTISIFVLLLSILLKRFVMGEKIEQAFLKSPDNEALISHQ